MVTATKSVPAASAKASAGSKVVASRVAASNSVEKKTMAKKKNSSKSAGKVSKATKTAAEKNVEKMLNDNLNLKNAVQQIEKTIWRWIDHAARIRKPSENRRHLDRLPVVWILLLEVAACHVAGSSRSLAQNQVVRPRSLCISLPKRRNWEASAR